MKVAVYLTEAELTRAAHAAAAHARDESPDGPSDDPRRYHAVAAKLYEAAGLPLLAAEEAELAGEGGAV